MSGSDQIIGGGGAIARAAAYGQKFRDGDRPLHPTASAVELRRAFGGPVPEAGEHGTKIIDQLITAAEPGLVGNTEPGFHAWVMGGSNSTGVAADWLTSVWGQNAGIYQCSPAAATAEEVAANWLLDILDLPRESSVGFSTGATMAGFICLAAARGEVLRRAGHDFDECGLHGAPQIRVFISEDSHISNLAALRYLGFGSRNIIRIAADDQGRMIIDDLNTKIIGSDGPAIIVATAGHINSGAFDDFEALSEIARKHDAWLHVDSAFGLWARASDRLKPKTSGLYLADSWSTDGHKWLQVPYDSGFAIVRHREAHRRAMDISASYLSEAPGDGRNPTHFSPELSRRARGFSVWATLKAFGRQGIAKMVEGHCRGAGLLAHKLGKLPGVVVHNDVVLNQIVVSFSDGVDADGCTSWMEETLNSDGNLFFRTTVWKGQIMLRISVIEDGTSSAHLANLADRIEMLWGRHLSERQAA